MVEETQVAEEMLQSAILNNQQLPLSNQRRSGGFNVDSFRGKGKDVGTNGVSSRQKGLQKVNKNFKQSFGAKKISKNPKKYAEFDEEESHYEEEILQPQNLLNFHYAPLRTTYVSSNHGSNYRSTRRYAGPVYNKESFLQANCHFVMDDVEKEKYMVHAVDPDILVEWNKILLVYLPTHENPECPICLYPPKVAKITRCGHVFCWACIIHYLKLSEKSWSKCPICHEALHEGDLKRVITCQKKKFARLDNITMTLMAKQKGSLVVLPANEFHEDKVVDFQRWDNLSFHLSSKIMLADKQQVTKNVLLKEKVVLETQLQEAITDQTGEECFIKIALEKLNGEVERDFGGDMSLLEQDALQVDELGVLSPDQGVSLEAVAIENEQIGAVCMGYEKPGHPHGRGRQREVSESASSEASIGASSLDQLVGEIGLRERNTNMNSTYFYQSSDGQNIFIHSLNAKCIIEEYGSLCDGPLTITGQIIDFECLTMTKDLRKRYRYLSHLPLAAEFIICELMLRPPVLSKNTIRNFMSEFQKRKAARLKKMEDQRRFDRKASNARNREEGYRVEYYSDDDEDVRLDLNNEESFPQSFSSPEALQSISPPQDDFLKGASFAQKLKQQSNTLPSNIAKGWGVTQPSTIRCRPEASNMSVLLPRNSTAARVTNGDDDEDGPGIVAPSYKDTFTAAMFDTQFNVTENVVNSSNENTKKKGRKAKGKLLFSTGSQRKY